MENKATSAPLHSLVGRFYSCPICLMPMNDSDGGCIRHDIEEINKYIDSIRVAWQDIKRTVDSCDSGVGLFVKNRMNDWESYMFLGHNPPNAKITGPGEPAQGEQKMTINPGSGASPCWADISSAPRDKIILIAFTICRDPEPQVRESKWSEQDGSFVSVNRFLIYDTAFAWMPMPDPPNSLDQ